MLSDDVEMLMCHCRNSLSANGELLGAMTRVKNTLESFQQPIKQYNKCKQFTKKEFETTLNMIRYFNSLYFGGNSVPFDTWVMDNLSRFKEKDEIDLTEGDLRTNIKRISSSIYILTPTRN